MTVFVVDVNKADILNLEKCLIEVYPYAKVILHIGLNAYKILCEVELAQPDCFIIEAELGNSDGIAIAKLIKQRYPSVNIVITNDSDAFGVEAWGIHAQGYLLKPITADKINICEGRCLFVF